MSKTTYISLLLAGAVLGCGDDVSSEKIASPEPFLVSSEKIATIPMSDLKNLAEMTGQQAVQRLVRYGVDTYKVVYKTRYRDQMIQASGLIYVPAGLTEAAPLVSLHHGTTFLKTQAPTENSGFTGMEYFAAAGYIALMPDYIGYGASSSLFHPYYDFESAATTVVDFVRSAGEFLSGNQILTNGNLFLAGYSEGGYVTLAAAKSLEESPEFDVTAVAAGAGGYDLEAMLDEITASRYYAYPAYLAFVLMAYNTTYEWNKPLTYFFREKYAAALDTVMNGQYDGWLINSRLTTDVHQLLNPAFLERLKDPDGEKELKAALRTNSVAGWKTDVPIQLYHGTRDEIIPASNSEGTAEAFKSLGSSEISLTLIQGGTHGSSFVPMLQQFIPWFESFRDYNNTEK